MGIMSNNQLENQNMTYLSQEIHLESQKEAQQLFVILSMLPLREVLFKCPNMVFHNEDQLEIQQQDQFMLAVKLWKMNKI